MLEVTFFFFFFFLPKEPISNSTLNYMDSMNPMGCAQILDELRELYSTRVEPFPSTKTLQCLDDEFYTFCTYQSCGAGGSI
jgi:hypothetical protein